MQKHCRLKCCPCKRLLFKCHTLKETLRKVNSSIRVCVCISDSQTELWAGHTSYVLLDVVLLPLTPCVAMTALRLSPSTSSLSFCLPLCSSMWMTARATWGMPWTTTCTHTHTHSDLLTVDWYLPHALIGPYEIHFFIFQNSVFSIFIFSWFCFFRFHFSGLLFNGKIYKNHETYNFTSIYSKLNKKRLVTVPLTAK